MYCIIIAFAEYPDTGTSISLLLGPTHDIPRIGTVDDPTLKEALTETIKHECNTVHPL